MTNSQGSGVSLLLPSYDSVVLERVLRDIHEVQEPFKAWQQRYLGWMEFGFPMDLALGNVMRLGTLFNTRTVEERERKRSRYVTQWAGSRGDSLVSRLSSAKTNILPALYGDTQEQAAQERLVQLALGIFRLLDQQKVDGMGGFSWDNEMKQTLTWTGKVAFQVRVYHAGERQAGIEARFIDPYNLAHDIDTGQGERHRIVREYYLPWGDVPAEVAKYTDGKSDALYVSRPHGKEEEELAKLTDFWVRQPRGELHHAILVEGQPIRSGVTWIDHGYKRLPLIVVSRAGASHGFESVKNASLSAVQRTKVYYHAEPFYARAIPLLTFLQGLESLAADSAALAGLPIFLKRLEETGRGGVEERQIAPLAVLNLAKGETLEILQGIAAGRTSLDQEIARVKGELSDIYPDILVGQIDISSASGYSVNSQRIDQGKTFMGPWTRCAQSAKEQLIATVIDQHIHVFPGLTFNLRGIMPEGGSFGVKFAVKDYPKGTFDIDVQEPAEIPGQVLQNEGSAISMVAAGGVSWHTARVTKLGISEPGAEQARIDEEKFHNSPVSQNVENLLQLGRKADAAREEAGKYKIGTKARLAADAVAIQYERMLKAETARLEGATQTGFTMPKESGNLPTNVLPTQNTIENPQDRAFAEGRPSTGIQGRPRSPGTP